MLFGKGDLTKESRPDAQLREVYPSLPEDASGEHARGSSSFLRESGVAAPYAPDTAIIDEQAAFLAGFHHNSDNMIL